MKAYLLLIISFISISCFSQTFSDPITLIEEGLAGFDDFDFADLDGDDDIDSLHTQFKCNCRNNKRSDKNKVITCLVYSKLPQTNWNFAMCHIIDCKYAVPHRMTKRTPYEGRFRTQPRYFRHI